MRTSKPVLLIASALFLATLAACAEAGTPPACTEVGQSWQSPTDGASLVCVPAGEFLMGAADSDEDARQVEKPQHTVDLDTFWIDQYEVTNAQYALCVNAGVCYRSQEIGGTGVASRTQENYFYDERFADFPALVYTSAEAETYCAWAGRRLPSEAEWEKAARGTDGRIYPWGDAAPTCELANIPGCSSDTTAVGSYPAGNSPYGAADMLGNVWEWVADTFDPDFYAISPTDNPTGPDYEDYQVRRGGGWRSLLVDLRVTRRADGAPAHYFDAQMGFRCAAGAP